MMKKWIVGLIGLVLAGASFAEYATFQAAIAAGNTMQFKNKDVAAAKVVYEAAKGLASKPHEGTIAEARVGGCLIKLGQVDEGVARLKTALETGPGDQGKALACALLGEYYGLTLKDKETALKYFKQALTYEKAPKSIKKQAQKKIEKFSK